jgi:hypothetical protein
MNDQEWDDIINYQQYGVVVGERDGWYHIMKWDPKEERHVEVHKTRDKPTVKNIADIGKKLRDVKNPKKRTVEEILAPTKKQKEKIEYNRREEILKEKKSTYLKIEKTDIRKNWRDNPRARKLRKAFDKVVTNPDNKELLEETISGNPNNHEELRSEVYDLMREQDPSLKKLSNEQIDESLTGDKKADPTMSLVSLFSDQPPPERMQIVPVHPQPMEEDEETKEEPIVQGGVQVGQFDSNALAEFGNVVGQAMQNPLVEAVNVAVTKAVNGKATVNEVSIDIRKTQQVIDVMKDMNVPLNADDVQRIVAETKGDASPSTFEKITTYVGRFASAFFTNKKVDKNTTPSDPAGEPIPEIPDVVPPKKGGKKKAIKLPKKGVKVKPQEKTEEQPPPQQQAPQQQGHYSLIGAMMGLMREPEEHILSDFERKFYEEAGYYDNTPPDVSNLDNMNNIEFTREYNRVNKLLNNLMNKSAKIGDLKDIKTEAKLKQKLELEREIIQLQKIMEAPQVIDRHEKINKEIAVTTVDRKIRKEFIQMTEEKLLKIRKKSIKEEFNILEKERYKRLEKMYKDQINYIKEQDSPDRNENKLIEMNTLLTEQEASFRKWRDEVYEPAKDVIDKLIQEDKDNFRESLKAMNEGMTWLGDHLFAPFKQDKDYIIYDKQEFKELFNMYFNLRDKISDVDPDVPDFKFINKVMDKIELLMTRMDNGKKTRDMDAIYNDTLMKRDLFAKYAAQEKTKANRQGYEYYFKRNDQRIYDDLNTSIATVNAEKTIEGVRAYLEKNSPATLQEAVKQMTDAFEELEERIKLSPTAEAYNLQQIFNATFLRYKNLMGNVSAGERQQFEKSLLIERESLMSIVSKNAYARVGLGRRAGEDRNLQKFLMDPTSFKNVNSENAVPFTHAGLTLRDSRRVIAAMHRLMNLRERMTKSVHEKMNIEYDDEAWKFDTVLTHLYPPSYLQMNLRYYLQLPKSANGKKGSMSPFIKAIKVLLPDFDPDKISKEEFISKVGEISTAAETFLQQKSEGTMTQWGDIQNMSDECVRELLDLITQAGLKSDEQVEEELADDYAKNATQDPTGDGPQQDIDSYNPAPVGQLARDLRDDAKRQNYMRLVGSLATPSLNDVQQEPYIPMHVKSARYFFNGDNYRSIQSKFESQKPLMPKTTVNDALRTIRTTIKEYGKILMIKGPKTNEQSHPALIQKEAIELLELKDAFMRYTSSTEGEFQTVGELPQEQPPQEPQMETKKTDDRSKIQEGGNVKETKNPEIQPLGTVDPLTTGEDDTDQYNTGNNNASDRSTFERTYLANPWG